MRYLIKPCLLIQVGLSLLVNKNQIHESDKVEVVLSHNTDPDPLLTYGNQSALELFELTWEELIQLPSRLTAETPDRAERARRLAEVAARGFIDDYSDVRVSRTGKRFRIAQATVWNLTDERGRFYGQAATFREGRALADAGLRRR